MIHRRIFLCGFMTSGKSTIGPILANVLGWSFYDLDKVIEEEQSKSIVDIFKDSGEKEFRKIESETLRRLIDEKSIVVSLGGGTMANKQNVELLKSSGTTIYLKISPEVIYRRIKNKIDRPAFREFVLNEEPPEKFLDKINKMLIEREPFYLQSDLVIDTDATKIGNTVDLIAKKIKKMMYAKD